MKNIHVVPTDKPSRLHKYSFESFALSKKAFNWKEAHNIYITSDKEIKEGDWCIDEKENIVKADKDFIFNCSHEFNEFWKKIILTTDQDLIKDGIQAIDDEFLEWFVKNPSCEEVEVEKDIIGCKGGLEFRPILGYKIIIPKEEPKQETLEEVAERLFAKEEQFIFKLGAKWQQERSYSEGEVYNIVEQAIKDYNNKQLHLFEGSFSNPIYTNLKKWFEQFKKK